MVAGDHKYRKGSLIIARTLVRFVSIALVMTQIATTRKCANARQVVLLSIARGLITTKSHALGRRRTVKLDHLGTFQPESSGLRCFKFHFSLLTKIKPTFS